MALILRGAQKSVQIMLLVAFLSTTIGIVYGADVRLLPGPHRRRDDAHPRRAVHRPVARHPHRALDGGSRAAAAGCSSPCCSGSSCGSRWPGWCAPSSCRCGRRSSSRRPGRWARVTPGSSSATSCRTSSGRSSSAPTLTMATAILLETALSFLGLGIRAPDTSLGLAGRSLARRPRPPGPGSSTSRGSSSSSSPCASTSSATACVMRSTRSSKGTAVSDAAAAAAGRGRSDPPVMVGAAWRRQ